MSGIPLIKPSTGSAFGASTTRRSIFSHPTMDLQGGGGMSNGIKDQLLDEDMEADPIPTLYLDPSPIGKGVSVKDWTAKNRTIRSTFRPNTNEVAVYVAGKKGAEEFPIKQTVSQKDTAVYLCQASIAEIRIPFITQMYGVFLNTTTTDPYKSPERYTRYYNQYYEGISRYLLQLYDATKKELESKDSTYIVQEIELMESVSAVWQLAEFMFLTPDKPIAYLFGEWLTAHDSAPDVEVGETLLRSAGKLSHHKFWPYIHQCLLRGMRKSVVFMIEQALNDEENDETADALDALVRILRGIPSSETTLPDGKSKERHRKWQEDCNKFTRSSHMETLGSDAKKALGILTGDIEEILELTSSWEEAFAAILLYTDPTCSRHDLGPILKICVSKYLEGNEISLLDRIKIAIMEMDSIKTIRLCGTLDAWLVAHLADVFNQYGYLDMSGIDMTDIGSQGWDLNIRDYFIISYAQSLMSDPNLWEAIAGYLLLCGVKGRAMLSEWICHVPLESSRKAYKVLRFCKDHDLTDSLQSIHRVIAVEEEKRGQYALAIQHFMSSKDPQRVAKVADNLMQNYLQSKAFDLLDTVSSIPAFHAPNDHVDFLRAYAKFHEEYKSGKAAKAGSTLISILMTDTTPKKYWAILLFDALPLLEHKTVIVFDTNATFVLMRALEELLGSQNKAEYLQLLPVPSLSKDSSTETVTEERESYLNTVRLSLVRNLARSIVHPSKPGSTV
ncbi:Nucleoporin nup85 [Lunasporangiospora selenospora]|uniref:Nuclear pore complex protein Nup85 n=1 Tax=Lunasporangiospora selenospora TaxID=979761 RepID=A0A9P6FTI4_9FUNG|nr:Nucleoporin nup85 [Lunasporangiospora selenospora]